MDELFSSPSALETDANFEATWEQYMTEISRLNELMRQDQIDSDRLKAESQELKAECQALKEESQVLKAESQVLKTKSQAIKIETEALKAEGQVLKMETRSALSRLEQSLK